MKCTTPMLIENSKRMWEKDKMIPVRCGKCEGCLKSAINDWAFRLEQEAKRSLYLHFVTLTYSPASVPLTPNLLPTIDKKEVQKFIKRLRKSYGKSLKYFAVGEYGSRSYRPHYHLILFNVEDPKKIEKAWSLNNVPLGHVHIGDDIGNGAIPYTLKYMYKKGLVPAFKDDDRNPEFRLMSSKLGDNYLTPRMIKWHLDDFPNRQYVMTNNGVRIQIPRFYREKLIKLWKGNRLELRNNDSVYMTEDDGDYRSLTSRIQNQRNNERKFEEKRNQQQRKTL